MIQLDYALSPSEISKVNEANLIAATNTEIDYYLFCGDVFFRIDDTRFDAAWGWVPVVDYATQLYLIASEIREGETRYLEYTESEAAIRFRRIGDDVEVAAEYVSANAVVPLYELQVAAKDFIRRVFSDLMSRWPKLAGNPFFNERVKMVEASK